MTNVVYLVHGWKIALSEAKRAMEDMPPEVYASGVRLVFGGGDMKEAFLGQIVASITPDGISAAGPRPLPTDVEKVRKGAQLLGLESLAADEPQLWVFRD